MRIAFFSIYMAFVSLPILAEVLTFDKILSEALLENKDLGVAKADLDAAENKLMAKRGALYPSVDLKFTYDNVSAQSQASSSSTEYSSNLIVTQELFSGLSDFYKIEGARLVRDGAKLNYKIALIKLKSDVKKVYANLLYYQDLIKLLNNVIKSREDNAKLVELRYTNGREHKGSMLLAKAFLEQSKLDLISATNSKVSAMRELLRIMGRSETETLEVKDDFKLDTAKVLIKNKNIDSVARQSLSHQINLNSLEQASNEIKSNRT
jgi:outer membrane protein